MSWLTISGPCVLPPEEPRRHPHENLHVSFVSAPPHSCLQYTAGQAAGLHCCSWGGVGVCCPVCPPTSLFQPKREGVKVWRGNQKGRPMQLSSCCRELAKSCQQTWSAFSQLSVHVQPKEAGPTNHCHILRPRAPRPERMRQGPQEPKLVLLRLDVLFLSFLTRVRHVCVCM